jgi:hypothetical protein
MTGRVFLYDEYGMYKKLQGVVFLYIVFLYMGWPPAVSLHLQWFL